MNDAVIVSTARTPIGRAFRGALNNIKSPTLMGQAICHAVARAKIEADEVEDVIIGTVLAAGTAGMNIARHASYVAGLPVTTSSQTMDRQCASGLMAVATAAKQIIVDGMPIVVAGGQENISAVQAPYFDWVTREQDRNSVHAVAEAYMPMLQTAEFVAKKYAISREARDLYSLESQQRTAAAQRNGGFDAEIVRINATMAEVNKQTKEVTNKNVTLAKDEGNRPDTSLGGLQKLEPVLKGGVVTAGNASQLSDGASACVVMNARLAERKGLQPLGLYREMAVAGCSPEEMGIGPIYAIPKLAQIAWIKNATSASGNSMKPSLVRRYIAEIFSVSIPPGLM